MTLSMFMNTTKDLGESSVCSLRIVNPPIFSSQLVQVNEFLRRLYRNLYT